MLTVKGGVRFDVAMVTSATSTGPAAALRGTPVVPGLAHGPVVLVSQEVSPTAIEAYGDGGYADTDAAMTAYDAAAGAVADGFTARAARASGAASEVLTASAGLARDSGLKQAVATRAGTGEGLLAAVHGGVAQFVDVFTAMGGLMAERATDLLDIERRIVAHLVGEPEPGVAEPDVPSVLVASDLAPADTAGLDPELVLALVTERGGATSHTAIIARQLGIPCVVGVGGALELASGAMVLVDATVGTIETGIDDDEARAMVEEDRAPGRPSRPGPGRDGPATAYTWSCSPTWPTRSRPAWAPTPRSRASGCSAPSCASSTVATSPAPARSRPARYRAQSAPGRRATGPRQHQRGAPADECAGRRF